ncbi:MAG: hypothetical protein JSU86_20515 [Phycisphaerales bacterium]|nr:MAG: hypothetical protein JSU86_20515 [Phycisphaerales bacterium]
MYASLLFWLALALPGYVIVRRVSEDDLKSGLLGTLGLSYLVTLGLLSPVSILCYLLRAPLGIFSGACAIAVVAATVEITRRRWWREIGELIIGGASFGLIILLADLVMGARVGALVGGDAVLHLARVRVLLDHGFGNYDPFVGPPYFFPIYHTSLHHALFAACSQLTGIHHVFVWFASLPWAKLVVAAGAYYMAWCVFDRRWVGWAAAVFMVGLRGPLNFLNYPNKLAPLWIGALMIGFAVQACQSPCTWRSVLKLAVGSLVLGQVHSLYGAFMGIVLGPVLGCVAMVRVVRRQPDCWRLATCTVALTAALPFLLISERTTASRSAPSRRSVVKASTPDQPESTDTKEAWVRMGPRAGWGSRDWRTACLGAGIICALVGSRRRQALILLAIAGTAALIFYVPPLCTAAVEVLGKKWILGRMGFVLLLGFVGLAPAAAAFLVEPRARLRWVNAVISVPALCFALYFGGEFANHKEPYTWETYYTRARSSRAAREAYLDHTRLVVAFCDKHIPRGVTVLLEEWPGTVLTMIHDCHIVVPHQGSMGVPDRGPRRRDLKTMLAAETPWETRRALLRKYDIKYFFPAESPTQWAQDHLKDRVTDQGFRLFVLDTSR